LSDSFEEYWFRARKLIDERMEEEIEEMRFSRYVKKVVSGGKRFRGTLTMLTAQALGGKAEDALPFSVAVEFVHQGTLIHDDFFDGHDSRRGRLPLYKVLDPRRAFMIADMMLSIAQWKLTGSRDGYQTLAKAIYETCQGAIMEPLNQKTFLDYIKDKALKDTMYLTIAGLKTAELYGAACKLGAISAAPKDQALLQKAHEYGVHLGIAYQMADDLTDYIAIRKHGATDIVTVTKLVPFLLHLVPSAIPKLAYLFPDGKLKGITTLLDEEDIPGRSHREIDHYVKMAKDTVRVYFPDNKHAKLLLEAPSYLVRKLLEEIA